MGSNPVRGTNFRSFENMVDESIHLFYRKSAGELSLISLSKLTDFKLPSNYSKNIQQPKGIQNFLSEKEWEKYN
jgi:hypothetical protein